MAYDLLAEAFLPFRRRSGIVFWGTVADLTDALADDPVVAVASPRADFDGALQEFLIGVLTAALTPATEIEWKQLWDVPPTRLRLAQALGTLPCAAFVVDGEGARAFQDRSSLPDAKVTSIAQLLIEAPGEQGMLLNTDLFNKRGRVSCLGIRAAVMAVITMQTYAPSGGQGHRTSLRGGGPLTTLVDPRIGMPLPPGLSSPAQLPLWYKLWANVETAAQLNARAVAREADSDPVASAFPWMGATRSSAKDAKTTTADGDPLQAYFGLPRRIRLEFGPEGPCDVFGTVESQTVTAFRLLKHGVAYAAWMHPLSPYRLTETGWLAVHGQPGGIGWREWLGLTLAEPSSGRRPSQSVAHFTGRASLIGCRQFGVHAFGYDTDNMKARGWVEAHLPVFTNGSQADYVRSRALAARLMNATNTAALALVKLVQAALFPDLKDVPGDKTLAVTRAVWSDTERPFYAALRELVSTCLGEDDDAGSLIQQLALQFHRELSAIAVRIFEQRCQTARKHSDSLRRIVVARYDLDALLSGRSSEGAKLRRDLGLLAPAKAKHAKAKHATRKTVATTSLPTKVV